MSDGAVYLLTLPLHTFFFSLWILPFMISWPRENRGYKSGFERLLRVLGSLFFFSKSFRLFWGLLDWEKLGSWISVHIYPYK